MYLEIFYEGEFPSDVHPVVVIVSDTEMWAHTLDNYTIHTGLFKTISSYLDQLPGKHDKTSMRQALVVLSVCD